MLFASPFVLGSQPDLVVLGDQGAPEMGKSFHQMRSNISTDLLTQSSNLAQWWQYFKYNQRENGVAKVRFDLIYDQKHCGTTALLKVAMSAR